jgi:hypothetical protein
MPRPSFLYRNRAANPTNGKQAMSGRGGGYISSPHNIRDVWVINPKNDRNTKVLVKIRVHQGDGWNPDGVERPDIESLLVNRDDELAELIRTAWECKTLALYYTRVHPDTSEEISYKPVPLRSEDDTDNDDDGTSQTNDDAGTPPTTISTQ